MNKQEFLMWRDHPVTLKLVEALKFGKEAAIDDLISKRGGVGDYQRGAIANASEVIDIIRTGDIFNLAEEGE